MTVTEIAEVSYGGIPITNILASEVTMRPIPNDQGTAIKYVEHIFEFEWLIDLDGTTQQIDDYRQTFGIQGLPFVYRGKGYGSDLSTLNSLSGTTQQDINMGPKPGEFKFRVIGQAKAAKATWSVTVALPECGNNIFNGLVEFWAKTRMTIKKNGYKKLIRDGRIEIMSNVYNDTGSNRNRLRASLSNPETFITYIESLEGDINMAGFHLEYDFDFTPDDKACVFTLTYDEIESDNPYPNGVVNIDAEHDMGSSLMSDNALKAGFKTWLNNLTMEIELLPSVPKLTAWVIFTSIVGERLSDGVSVDVVGQRLGQPITKAKVPIILDLNVSESIFGHKLNFSISWTSYANSMDEIFSKSGMFKKVTGVDWDLYTASLRDIAQKPNGTYPLGNLGATEVVIDPCNQIIEDKLPITSRPAEGDIGIGLFGVSCPPPESSWIDYQNIFTILTNTGQRVFRKYKQPAGIIRGQYRSVEINREESNVPPQTNTQSSESDYIVQDFGNDMFKVNMRGFAIRMGYPTNPPDIDTFGGRQVRMLEDISYSKNQVLVSYGDCPIYLTRWSLTYEVLGQPTGNTETNRVTSGEPGDSQ